MGRKMTPERWARVEEVYYSALEREPGERASFVTEACGGDEELRAEVESLIASQEGAGSFMASPVFDLGLTALSEPELGEGERLGSHQILGRLGEGGMGVVYLARDTRLGRKVALKLLPPSLRRDEGRLRRLRREAQAASSLNHPNILTIYEVGEAEQGLYIASEYVDGKTLRDRIKSGLEFGEALDAAIQIASALAAAHSAGIVHRDIKPENVMIRPDGYVKVLDFGLAKLGGPQAAGSSTDAPTRSLVRTDPGLVMGTAKYMSPEQARGHETDARTDLFSLGVVLYEMVARHTPFDGETPSDLIATLLRDEPAPLARYAPDAPEGLQRILGRALSKDKQARYQSAGEMLADLKRLKAGLEVETNDYAPARTGNGSGMTATLPLRSPDQTAGGPGRPTGATGGAPALSSAEYIVGGIRRHKAGAGVALLALFAFTAAAGLSIYKFFARPQQPASSANVKMARLTASGKATGAAISPDGRHVAYVNADAGQQSLWIRQVATSSNVQIVPPGVSSFWGLTFSRDGDYLYYFGQGKDDREPALYQMPALGGLARKLIEGVVNSSGGGPVTFSPDGKHMAFVREYPEGETAVVVAAADGTGVRKIASPTGGAYFTSAAWSPDGAKIAVAGGRRDEGGAARGELIEVQVDGGAQKPITAEGWDWIGDVAWLPDGSRLLVTGGYQTDAILIWEVPYPEGPPRKLAADLSNYNGLSLTVDGAALVTARRDQVMTLWSQTAGEAATGRQLTSGSATADGWSGIDCAPDGRIYYTSNASGHSDIWVMDADGGNQKQLTAGLGSGNFGLSVSPDGRYIVFVSHRAGGPNVWRVNIDGGNPKQLTDSEGAFNPFFMPDGWVSYARRVAGQPVRMKVPVEGGDPQPMFGAYPDVLGVSPNGRFVAYLPPDERGGKRRVAVGPAEGGDPVKVFELPPGAMPRRMRWSPDGRALTYVVTRGGVSNVWSQPLGGGQPVRLTDFKSETISNFAWSPDGKRLVMARGTTTTDVVLVSNFR